MNTRGFSVKLAVSRKWTKSQSLKKIDSGPNLAGPTVEGWALDLAHHGPRPGRSRGGGRQALGLGGLAGGERGLDGPRGRGQRSRTSVRRPQTTGGSRGRGPRALGLRDRSPE